MPIPKELGADGVNYHIFRYEKGEAGLSPEESYQFDAGIYWHNEALDIRLDSYVNYFPNYIYLNPTSAYTEGLQTYYYTQSRVIRYGVEADIRYRFLRRLEAVVKGIPLCGATLRQQERIHPALLATLECGCGVEVHLRLRGGR